LENLNAVYMPTNKANKVKSEIIKPLLYPLYIPKIIGTIIIKSR